MLVCDIADMVVSNHPEDLLVTYSLGSCVGVVLYDPAVRVGGMVHCMLPLSRIDEEKAERKPSMFVDTGLVRLLQTLFDMGLRKSSAKVTVAGGSRVLDDRNLFRIGERNYAIVRKVLWKNGMMINAEDVGGNVSRTLRCDMSTGRVWIKSGGVERVLQEP
jgi:chemotaxis protein CheD